MHRLYPLSLAVLLAIPSAAGIIIGSSGGGSITATFDHLSGTSAPVSFTVTGAGLTEANGVTCMNGTIVAGSGGTCPAAVAGETFFNHVTAATTDAALAYRTSTISLSTSRIYWFAFRSSTTGASYIYLNDGVPAEGTNAGVFGATGKALFRVEAQNSGANIGISRYEPTARTRTQWNSSTNAWASPTVNANATLPGSFQVVGIEIDGPGRRWRVHVMGQTGTSNTPSASLYQNALTDWVLFSFHEGGSIFCNPTCTSVYLAVGEPLTDAATATTYFEWYAETGDSVVDGWVNGRNSGGNWDIYHIYAYKNYQGLPVNWVPEDRTTTAVGRGGGGTWDENTVKDPYVILDGSTYYMMYSGGRVSDGKFQVGCASASAVTGPWTKCTGNPMVVLSAATTQDQVFNPTLIKDTSEPDANKRWKMIYVGADTSSPLNFRAFVRTCSAAPTAAACDTAAEWSAATVIADVGAASSIDEIGWGRVLPMEAGGVNYLFGGVRALSGGVAQQRQETYGTSSDRWLTAISKTGTVTLASGAAASTSCNTTTTAAITTTGSRSFTVADSTGCAADMFVAVDDDATSANGHHNRILNVVSGTALTMYHNEDALASGGRVRGPHAFWQIDTGPVGTYPSGYYKLSTCFDPMTGNSSTFDFYSETVCMWTASAITGTWSLYPLGSPAIPVNNFGRSHSHENLSLVNLPFSGPLASVSAAIDCLSFGQTATEGGSLTISYKTPIQCWASRSTVSGARINGDGLFGESWVPEVWIDWNWDDASQGTASRTGEAWDLGKAVGLVAAHVYAPSTFAETCGGGTNSLHTLTATVYSVVGGVRVSDDASVAVCVENPATTWPTPKAYCNDANCADDSFASVVQPGTPAHGGNGTDLETILEDCGVNGSERILVEGGVTFSTTSTTIASGTNSCLIESYGGSKVVFDFNGSSDRIDVAGCAKMRISGVTIQANDADTSVFSSTSGSGCVLVDDWDVAVASGERICSMIQDSSDDIAEWYFNDFDYTDNSLGAGTCGLSPFYIHVDHGAWINGRISVNGTGSHNSRFPNYRYITIDSMLYSLPGTHVGGTHLLAMRQNCGGGGVAPCTNEASSHTAALTRSEFRPADDSAIAIQINNDGSGATDEWTQAFDHDFALNVFAKATDANSLPRIYIDTDNGADSDSGRFRLVMNAADLTWMDSSTESNLHNTGGGLDYYIAGNAASCVGNCADGRQLVRNTIGGNSVVKNNVGYENGAGTFDLFPSFAEDTANNLVKTADPWDRDGAPPGTDATFTFADVRITSSNTSLKGFGVVTAYPTDAEGEAVPQSSDYDVGADDE